MQHHRKYLVVTIWVSTIAFVGAGFVGWGQYSYGDKAGAVAKVGDISITSGELQESYSALFQQYNQLFQGKFDEKQAQQFGLQRQAMRQLVNQALVLNLAESYGLIVSDEELLRTISSQSMFSKGGAFDKSLYEQLLKENRLTKKQYENNVRRELLIQKTLALLTSKNKALETNTLTSALGVADKVSYKLLTPAMISLSADEASLKGYWEQHKKEFMTAPGYTVSVVRQSPLTLTPSEKEINDYYTANRHLLKNTEGKLLELSEARSSIISALNDSATEKEALRLYIDFKKGTLKPEVAVQKQTFTTADSPYSAEITKEIGSLNLQKPFLKPRKVGNEYIIVKFESLNPSTVKTYDEAKTEVGNAYLAEAKKSKLQELAQNSYKTFQGTVSDFVTASQSAKLAGLEASEASEFLPKLFSSKQKQGFITLESGNVILYNVLEQKLLQDSALADESAVAKLKGNLLDAGLIKTLESKYPVEIYVEGM
jgi:peptidyl-prolyl cis-trans isomerase D